MQSPYIVIDIVLRVCIGLMMMIISYVCMYTLLANVIFYIKQ